MSSWRTSVGGGLAALCAVGLWGQGCSGKATRAGLVVVVTSEVAPGGVFNELRIDITRNGASKASSRILRWRVEESGLVVPVGENSEPVPLPLSRLPATLLVQNEGGATPEEAQAPITVEVSAWDTASETGTLVARRTATLERLPSGEPWRALVLPIEGLCLGKCLDTPGKTCRAGTCVDVAEDAEGLPVYAPMDVFGGATEPGPSAQCFSRSQCFEGARVACPQWRGERCVVPLSGALEGATNVALLASQSCAGVECLYPLNREGGAYAKAGATWTRDGNELVLPVEACLQSVTLALGLGDRCPGSKSTSTPVCGAWSNAGSPEESDGGASFTLDLEGSASCSNPGSPPGPGGGTLDGGGASSDGGVDAGGQMPPVLVPNGARSCESPGKGKSACGPDRESCCATVRVPGGFFAPDYDGVDSTSTERRRVKVSPYLLDKYEVTVGRFRAFVKATTDAKAPWKPAKASGKHGHLSNGKGLVSTSNASLYEPGWRTVYDGALPSTLEKWTTQLRCDLLPTWTSTEGTAKEEERPINCVTWPMAYAFCIYDGGFLPSDFEWNYAASGGEAEYRYYPWSVPANSQAIDIALASYGDNGDVCRGDGLPACVLEDIFPVGTKTGKGRWGQADLGGNVAEWTLDKDNVRNALCNDCSNFDPTLDVNRRVRGGSLRSSPAELRAAASAGRSSTVANDNLGFRCARSPAP